MKDEDIEMLVEKLQKMHISDEPFVERMKRGYLAHRKHLQKMKEYREKYKEKAKERKRRLEEAQPEIRQKRLKQNRDRYYMKRYGQTEDEFKAKKPRRMDEVPT